jgi:hypothetical protein
MLPLPIDLKELPSARGATSWRDYKESMLGYGDIVPTFKLEIVVAASYAAPLNCYPRVGVGKRRHQMAQRQKAEMVQTFLKCRIPHVKWPA